MEWNCLKSISNIVRPERQDRGKFSWTLTGGVLFLFAGFILLDILFGGSVWLHVPSDRPFTAFDGPMSVSMRMRIPPIIPIPSFVRFTLLFFAMCIGFIIGYIQSWRLSLEIKGLSRRSWWNWAAFFFTLLWYLFQGIWKKGLVLLLILILVTILPKILSWRIEDYLTGLIPLEPQESVFKRLEEKILKLEELDTMLLKLKALLDKLQALGIWWIAIHCGRNAEIDFYRKFGMLNKS